MRRLLALGLSLLGCFLATLSWGQEPVPVGTEFYVDTFTTRQHTSPKVEIDSSGDLIVVWNSGRNDNGDTSGQSVQARKVSRTGTPLGTTFLVSTYTTGNQIYTDVAVLPNDDFVVAWTDDHLKKVHGRRFSSDGTPLTSIFEVSTVTPSGTFVNHWEPEVAAMDDGTFLVAWSGVTEAADTDLNIQGRLFDSAGAAVGAQFQINTYTVDAQNQVDVAAVESDGLSDYFVVVWQSDGDDQDSSGYSTLLRPVSTSGSFLTSPMLANEATADDQRNPSIAGIGTDRFVVVWEDGPSSEDIKGRVFEDFFGEPQFQVNTYTTNAQGEPRVASDADGGFVVTWSSFYSSPGDDHVGRSVLARRFASDETPRSDDFQVNSITTGSQMNPDLAMDDEGDFWVAWRSTDESPNGNVRMRQMRVTGDVGDRVWADDNANGIQDEGESGLSGVTVDLYTDLGAPVDQATTDGDGLYQFAKLEPGNYYLDVTAPLGAVFSPTDLGGNDGVDSDVDAAGETGTFSVAAGVADLSRDAGVVLPGISGFVWLDLDEDGIQDPGELGRAGVTVILLDAGSTPLAETTTDSDGLYSFRGLASGSYRFQVLLPSAGFLFSPANAGGDDLLDSDVDAGTGISDLIAYTEGTNSVGNDAGLIALPVFSDGFESGDVSNWSSAVP